MVRLLCLAVALALAVTACGDSGSDPAPPTGAAVDAHDAGTDVGPTADSSPTPEVSVPRVPSETRERVEAEDEAACVYTLRDDLTGETEELAPHTAIPDTFYLSLNYETAAGVFVAVRDTKNPDLDATIIAPPCKRDEVLKRIDFVQRMDKAWAEMGIAFEERVYYYISYGKNA